MTKPVVAFVCTHNACRSQMAQAIATHLASSTFTAVSAGTHPTDAINPDAVACIRDRYGIDMTATQAPKTLDALPPVDVLVTMGCGVACPTLPCTQRTDWGLTDPTGQGKQAFQHTADVIERKVLELQEALTAKKPLP